MIKYPFLFQKSSCKGVRTDDGSVGVVEACEEDIWVSIG
jgi:hypothetical protein